MRKKYQQFIIRLTIISLILGFLILILGMILPQGIISAFLPLLLILFFVVTAIVHYVLLKITVLNPGKFVGYFMLATFLKLMIYLIVVLIFAFNVKEGVLPFILSFFTLYIIYSVFEVVSILAQTKE